MGKIASAATVYATAYLTEKGRTYLFNKGNIRFDSSGNDLFQIQTFALGDPDTNYKTTLRLASGDVPDITGKSEGCLKSTTDYVQTTLSYFTVDALAFANPLYSTNLIGNTLTVSTDTAFPVNSPTDVPPTGGAAAGGGGGIGTGVVTTGPGGSAIVSSGTVGTVSAAGGSSVGGSAIIVDTGTVGTVGVGSVGSGGFGTISIGG